MRKEQKTKEDKPDVPQRKKEKVAELQKLV